MDQKGSLVSEEKFRFDFSFNRAVAAEELSRLEGIVNGVIKAGLPVHNEVVPLNDALAIQVTRAPVYLVSRPPLYTPYSFSTHSQHFTWG